MFNFLRRREPCAAEKLLDENVRISRELSEALAGAVDEVTTIFDRRMQDVRPISERRKVARG